MDRLEEKCCCVGFYTAVYQFFLNLAKHLLEASPNLGRIWDGRHNRNAWTVCACQRLQIVKADDIGKGSCLNCHRSILAVYREKES
jgi:hypothetical protein